MFDVCYFGPVSRCATLVGMRKPVRAPGVELGVWQGGSMSADSNRVIRRDPRLEGRVVALASAGVTISICNLGSRLITRLLSADMDPPCQTPSSTQGARTGFLMPTRVAH